MAQKVQIIPKPGQNPILSVGEPISLVGYGVTGGLPLEMEATVEYTTTTYALDSVVVFSWVGGVKLYYSREQLNVVITPDLLPQTVDEKLVLLFDRVSQLEADIKTLKGFVIGNIAFTLVGIVGTVALLSDAVGEVNENVKRIDSSGGAGPL